MTRTRRTFVAATVVTAVLAAGVIIVAAQSTGTFALWRDSATVDAGVLFVGEADVEVVGVVGPEAFANMLPGERRTHALTVANTGSLDLAVSAAATTPTSPFELRLTLATDGCAVTPTAAGAAPVTETLVGIGALDAGQSSQLCVEVTASPALIPGEHIATSVVLEGS